MKLDIKKNRKFLFTLLLFMPIVVFADSGGEMTFSDVFSAHLFITIFSYFVLISPLAVILKPDAEAQKEMKKTLFWGRVILILIIDMFSPIFGFLLDFISIFVGACYIAPKSTKVTMTRQKNLSSGNLTDALLTKSCPKCNAMVKDTDLFCIKCGERFESANTVVADSVICPQCKRKLPPGNYFCIHCGQSVSVSEAVVNNTELKCSKCQTLLKATDLFCTSCGQKTNFITTPLSKAIANSGIVAQPAFEGQPVDSKNFAFYEMSEDQMLTTIIENEIIKNGEKKSITIAALEKKKNIFAIVYSIILFICISLLFFHTKTFGIVLIMIVVSFIYFGKIKKYNLVQYLKKEVISRPDEKINYIVSTVISGKINVGGNILLRLGLFIIAIGIPLFIFREPHIIYEQQDNDYVVRFYTVGVFENDEVLEIPAKYNGKDVVGIRGDVFANVKTLKEVILPDTIKEIRGGAFKNARYLEKINLPEGLSEIKGNTFENCYRLEEITIPDSVTRIGGHAFRNNISLEKVNISKDSELQEIGSSAFRNCTELEDIVLPTGVSINARAFKGSPTIVMEYTSSESFSNDNSLSYKYDSFVFMHVGETKEINSYISAAILQNAEISLINVSEKNGLYEFELKYSDENGDVNFVLSKSSPYKIINNFVVIEIVDDYVFESYSDKVSLTIFYN